MSKELNKYLNQLKKVEWNNPRIVMTYGVIFIFILCIIAYIIKYVIIIGIIILGVYVIWNYNKQKKKGGTEKVTT